MHGIDTRIRLLTALVGGCALIACGAPAPSWLEKGEPPAPGFNHISDQQLQSAMWRLAAGVRDIRAILASERPDRSVQQPEILRVLDDMIAAADELGPKGGVVTDHWVIPHSLGRFREKLAIARDAAARNPPRYYLVGNLSGTCLSCHEVE